jgi:hypothetical protein
VGWAKKMNSNYIETEKLFINKRDIAIIVIDIANAKSLADVE